MSNSNPKINGGIPASLPRTEYGVRDGGGDEFGWPKEGATAYVKATPGAVLIARDVSPTRVVSIR